MKLQHWFLLLALGVSACVTAGGTQMTVEPTLPVPDISNLKPQWIDGDCRSMAINAANHKTCIAYLASQLPPFDPQKREYFGEQYSPHKFLECALKQPKGIDGACEKYRLRRVENPEYWPNPDVPKPKWPDPPKETVYKPGMSSKQYFEALCKAEAGEFIYRTVENVEGVYQVRPRTKNEDQNNDLYAVEDPYVIDRPSSPWMALNYLMPGRYQFFESPTQKSTTQVANKVERFSGSDGRNPKTLQREYADFPKSRYAFTWRGIQRLHDREMGIAGSELAILDLQTNEILAIRRGFSRRDYVPNTMPQKWWGADSCPVVDPLPIFLLKVVKPANSKD